MPAMTMRCETIDCVRNVVSVSGDCDGEWKAPDRQEWNHQTLRLDSHGRGVNSRARCRRRRSGNRGKRQWNSLLDGTSLAACGSSPGSTGRFASDDDTVGFGIRVHVNLSRHQHSLLQLIIRECTRPPLYWKGWKGKGVKLLPWRMKKRGSPLQPRLFPPSFQQPGHPP